MQLLETTATLAGSYPTEPVPLDAELQHARALLLQKAVQQGASCQKNGLLSEAEDFYRIVLTEEPDHAEANHNMGVLALNMGLAQESLPYLQKAIQTQTVPAHYWMDYIDALIQSSRLMQAWRALRDCFSQKVEVGQVFGLLMRLSVAMKKSLVLAQNYSNKKLWREDARKFSSLRNARPSPSDKAKVMEFVTKLRLVDAEAMSIDMLIQFPLASFGWMALGTVWSECRVNPTLAVQSLRWAVELEPGEVNNFFNLGGAMLVQGRMGEAQACYRECLKIDPSLAAVHSNYLFTLGYNSEMSPSEVFAEHLRYAHKFETPFRSEWPKHANNKDPERRLKIGFVSPDLRSHVVTNFIEPLWVKMADDPLLSLHVYYTYPIEDAVSERLKGLVHQWNSVVDLSSEVLAKKISDDQIDILVDLSGHTARNRLLTFARKPAPVQVSWIGTPSTTGLEAMDYYFADRYLTPAGHPIEQQFTEKFVRLPASAAFQSEDNAPPVSSLPALDNGYITFGSFNRPAKISKDTVALWAKVLVAIPDAKLLIGGVDLQSGITELLTEWLTQSGIDSSRFSFLPRCGMPEYLAAHAQVDICLDTITYGGGTTTFHALWMGVPTLSLVGSTMPSRGGLSIMSQAGCAQFAVESKAVFVDTAVYWNRNLQELANIRNVVGARMRATHDVDGMHCKMATAVSGAFRTIWRRWCAGLPPESFDA